MKNKLLYIGILLVFGFSNAEETPSSNTEDMLELLNKTFYKLRATYVDSINDEEIIKAGIRGMLKPLDPYTKFLVGSSKDRLEMMTKGKYGGVGIRIGMRRDTLVVLSPMEASPAYQEGIMSGDKIIQVDSTSTIGMKQTDAAELIRGEMGTEIILHILRPSTKERLKFTLTRSNIKVEHVPYWGLDEYGIGYIRITKFSKHTASDFHKALKDLVNKDELTGIVIDLRGNSGGLLRNAIAILDEFTDRKTELLNTKGRTIKSNKSMYARRNKTVSPDIPVAVLINRSSASASEIVSGALQDLDRAVIVGQKSFGKGLVQSIYAMNDTATLKVTTAKYYTPSGRLIQKLDYLKNGVLTDGYDTKDTMFTTIGGRNVRGGGGITPDIEVIAEKLPPFVQALWRHGVFLNFAAMYNKSKVGYSDRIEITENILKDFEEFIKEDSLDYNEYGEKYLNRLKETLGKRNEFSDSKKSIFEKLIFWKPKKGSIDFLTQRLDKYYDKKKNNPFDDTDNLKWIINGLQREFSRVMCDVTIECHENLTGSKERIRVALFDDVIYQKAVEILLDANQYYSLLSPEEE